MTPISKQIKKMRSLCRNEISIRIFNKHKILNSNTVEWWPKTEWIGIHIEEELYDRLADILGVEKLFI